MASPAVLEFEKRLSPSDRAQWDTFTDDKKEEHVARVQKQQQELFKEYAEASSEEGKIAALDKYRVPEAQRAQLRGQLEAEIARQKSGTTPAPTKPVDSSFRPPLQRPEPEVLANLEYFAEPTEDQAIVSALLLWAVFGTKEQKEAAKIILGEVSAETLKDQAKCEELVRNFNRQKFNQQKLQLKIRQIKGKFYVLISETMVVAANEVKENLLKHEVLPAEVPAKISFKVLTEKANQDNFLKSLRTQFLPEGKTTRDENVKSAELVKEELVVEFKDEAKLRLKFSGDGAIQATYQAKETDLKTKDAVLLAFTQMAKKFYATFLEAELASNKDACPESFDITISLQSSELAGVSAAEIAKQFHENGFAKVCVKIDEVAETFETKEPKSFAPPKTESPIALQQKKKQEETEQREKLAKFQAKLKEETKKASAAHSLEAQQALALTKRYADKPDELATYTPPKRLPPTKLAWFNSLRDMASPLLAKPDLRASHQAIAKLAADPSLSEEQQQQRLVQILQPSYAALAQQTMYVDMAKGLVKWPLTYLTSLPIAYFTSGGAFSTQALGLALNAAATEASERYWVRPVMESGFGVSCPPPESLGKNLVMNILPSVAASYVAGMNPLYSSICTPVFKGLASAAAAYVPEQYAKAKIAYKGHPVVGALIESAERDMARLASNLATLFTQGVSIRQVLAVGPPLLMALSSDMTREFLLIQP